MRVPTRAVPNTIATMSPERVSLSSRRMQGAASPPIAGKQIIPVAQDTIVVSVGVQLKVFPLETEQAVVGLTVVSEHTSGVVALVMVSRPVTVTAEEVVVESDEVVESLVVESVVEESVVVESVEVVAAAEAVVESTVVLTSALDGEGLV